jgi:hypothetical protein
MKVVYSLKHNTFIVMFIIACRGCLKKNSPCYNFAIDDPNEENYTRNEMASKRYKSE